MLTQIEKGEANPTIGVLWKIANGYKCSFSSLIESAQEKPAVIKSSQVTPFIESNGGFINYPVFSFDSKRLFETYRIIINPNTVFAAEPHIKGAEEFLTVFSGEMELHLEDKIYTLDAGDSIRFAADIAHTYINRGTTQVQLTMIIYYNN